MTRLWYVFAATTLLLITVPLHANAIAPGQTVSPDTFTVSTAPPILNQITGTFNLDGGALIGSYVEGVLVDPFGVTCSGCLDFFTQVTLSSLSVDSITRVGLDSLKGTATDVGYVLGSGDVAPTSVLWAPSGTTLSFFLTLQPGQTTDYLVIATHATSYVTGGSLGLGGFNSTGTFNNGLALFQGQLLPTPVPEPNVGYLLSTGLLGVIVYRRKWRS